MKAYVRKIRRQKQLWCSNQVKIKTGEIVCIAHLAEGRAFVCPYNSNRSRTSDEFPCLDYDPIRKNDISKAETRECEHQPDLAEVYMGLGKPLRSACKLCGEEIMYSYSTGKWFTYEELEALNFKPLFLLD